MENIQLMSTNIPNLDAILGGGVPLYSLNVIAGQPGTGKTILAQQMLFTHVARQPEAKALYLTTLSEPALKIVRYMQGFDFFDPTVFEEGILYRDIGNVIREKALPEVVDHIVDLVQETGADILIIDSFRAIRDLVESPSAFRRFSYDLSVRLAGERCTTFLVGEYTAEDIAEGAEFAVADGILFLDTIVREGEERRIIRARKLRGRPTRMASFSFVISDAGIRVLSPALHLRREAAKMLEEGEREPVATGIPGVDSLLRGGILQGRSVILSGVSGTGKTTFALQFLVEGAQTGQKGLLFSFEESPDRLYELARGFGWDLAGLEEKGLLRIVFTPQTEVRVEEDLEEMVRQVDEFQPARIVVDSFSVFLHKVKDPSEQREKTFQLSALGERVGAVSLLVSDIPAHETDRLSRFGVEETVADGIIVLSTELQGLTRRRFIEVYKMRATDHVPGRHRFEIDDDGLQVFYAPLTLIDEEVTPLALSFEPLEEVIHGEVAYNAAWMIRGAPGVGKSTLAYQFAIEGLRRRESVLYITADAPAAQVLNALRGLDFLPDPYLESGQLVVLDAYGSDGLDLSDPEAFLFTVADRLEGMPRPCRKIIDSLTPLALSYTPSEFVRLVHRKNRVLRRPDVTIFDIMLTDILGQSERYSLLNAFDVVLNLYTPDWGEMGLAGKTGYRALQVSKARGVVVDTRPFPYTITSEEGVMVQKDFYRRQLGT